MADKKLRVEIIGDADSLKKAFGQADKSSSGLGSTLGGLGKTAALAGGAAGIGALVFGLKASLETSIEHQKAMAQTEAVVKSTGGAARVSAEDVANMADKIEKMSGMDDLAVQSGENMLLTFTNVRNEVGKGNDVFNQATSILADMSTALGTDMSKQAVQLGKALNDPIKGVSALSRVGVTFTEGQKKSIKAMVEAGDTMGAQKLILAELGKEFGGSAKAAGETFGGKMAILKARLDDVAQKIGDKLLPYLMRFVDWVLKNWPQISAAFEKAFAIIGSVINKLRPIFENMVKQIRDVVLFVKAIFEGDWSKAWELAKDIVARMFSQIWLLIKMQTEAIVTIFSKLGAAIGSALSSLGGVIDDKLVKPVVSAVTGLASSIVEKAKSVGTAIATGIGNGVTAATDKVTSAVTGIGAKIGALASGAWDAVVALGKSLAGRIAIGIATGGVSEVLPKVTEIGGKIGNMASNAWDAVVGLGKALVGKIGQGVRQAASLATDFINAVGSAVSSIAGRSWDAVEGIGRALVRAIASGVSSAVGLASSIINAVGSAAGSLAGRVWGQMAGLGRALVGDIASGISGAAGRIGGAISSIFSGLADWVRSILGIGSPSKVFMDIGHDIVDGLVKGLWNKAGDIKDAAKRLAMQLLVKWPYDRIRDLFKTFASVPDEVRKLFGQDVWDAIFPKTQKVAPGVPHPGVPAARGGLFTSPTLALIGENGPEAVVPLTPTHGGPAFGGGIAFGGGGGGGATVVLQNPILIGTGLEQAARELEPLVTRLQRRRFQNNTGRPGFLA